jgi:hypothetical protein
MSTPTTPTTPTTPATVAPPPSAALVTAPGSTPTGSGRSGGFLDMIKGMFVDPAGNMKTSTILSTVLLGGIGAYMGSGSGIMGMLGFGAAGAIGGTLAAPLLKGVFDWVAQNLLGITPDPSIPRNNNIPQASPDAVTRTQQPILQVGAPTVNATLVTPNLDRFAEINRNNVNIFTRLEDTRRQIESMPTSDPQRATLTDRMLSNEGVLQQYVSNTEAWNAAGTQWNNGERKTIIEAFDRARGGLGFAPRAGGPDPIPEAPTGAINIPRPSGLLGEVGRRSWNANRPEGSKDWESMNPREQINTATTVVENEISRLRPGAPGGISLESIGNSSNGRGVNRTFSLGGSWTSYNPFLWAGRNLGGSELKVENGTYNLASNAADVQNDLNQLLSGADGVNLSPEVLRQARAKAQQGIAFCDQGPDSVYTWSTATPADIQKIRNNFERVVQYTEALEARSQIAPLQAQVNQAVGNYVNGPAAKFPEFVTQVQGFRDNVNQMNQQVASLNQQQVKIKSRGASTTPPDENKQYITVVDDRNNSTVTMVAEKVGGNWQITNTFQGDFDAAKASDAATRLPTPMPTPDIFTDNGVKTTTNLGNAVRQAVMPMQARLGIAAPTVAASTTVTTSVTAPLATPTVTTATPSLI